jgi:hypothetical protein
LAPTIRGWAYTGPSTDAVHDGRTGPGAGVLTDTPLRSAVRS